MPPAINAQDLSTQDPTYQTVNPQQDSNDYNAIFQGIVDGLPEDTKTLDTAQEEQRKSLERIGELKQEERGKTAYQQAQEDLYGVTEERDKIAGLSTDLEAVTSRIRGLQRESQAIPLQVQEDFAGTGATDRGVQPITTGRLRENAIKALTQASIADAISSSIRGSQIRYDLAVEKANRAVELKYAPIEAEIKDLQEQISLNKEYIIEPTEKKILEAQTRILNERQRLLEQEKTREQNLNAIMLDVAKNGGSPETISKIQNAKSVSEAISIAGDSLVTPNTQVVKLGSSSVLIDTRTGKVIRTYTDSPLAGGGNSITGSSEYQTALQTILGSGKFTDNQASRIANAINSGDDPFTVIKNNAKDIMGNTIATQVTKYENARESMLQIQSLLRDYYAKGGKTNIFNGSFERSINKLGEISDPELVEIATQIGTALQTYRNAVSGTAYSVQEGREIAKIFPDINKSQGLNEAIIRARLKSFDTEIDSSYRTALGDSYDKIKGMSTPKDSSKGTKTDAQFVEQSLVSSGLRYDNFINNTPDGQIPVIENSTGRAGYINYQEFDSSKYTKA